MFQQSAQRLAGHQGELSFAPPMVVTNTDFRFIVTEQLAEAGIDPGPVLIEPEGRNTAPAVLAAALHLLAQAAMPPLSILFLGFRLHRYATVLPAFRRTRSSL